MLCYLLDTNICIYVIKNRPEGLRERFNRNSGALAISAVSLAELHYGAEKSSRPSQNLDVVARFVGCLNVLPFSTDCAAPYGQIRAELEARGTPIGPYDLMIAAPALSEDLTLVTNNLREFKRVTGLRVENWL